jgi:hypothetical protein
MDVRRAPTPPARRRAGSLSLKAAGERGGSLLNVHFARAKVDALFDRVMSA